MEWRFGTAGRRGVYSVKVGRRGLVHRGILKVSIVVVAAALVAAGAEASSSASAAKLSPLALGPTPEIGPPVTPGHFRGDVRRIQRGNIVRRDAQPEPKSPNET